MDKLHREAHLEAERQKKRQKFWRLGVTNHVCCLCPQADVLALIQDHVAGRKHDDTIRLICRNCDAMRTADQRCDPSPSENPQNVFEVIGRWLLSMASYFEILVDRLRLFGEFLINLAKAGYGNEFSFEF
jgi:hypothetical protein